MTSPAPKDGMQIEPERLAELVKAYAQSSEAVFLLWRDLRQQADIPAAWAHDAVSGQTFDHYKSQAIEGRGSTLWALSQWQRELESIQETLARMLAAYQANESNIAASMRQI